MKEIKLHPECIECLIKKHINAYPENATEMERVIYIKKIMDLIAKASFDTSAPELVEEINDVKEVLFGIRDDYTEVKKYFNKLMLKEEANLSEEIKKAENPLKKAFLFSMAANYIDFGALYKVDEEKLKSSFYDMTDDGAFDEEFINLTKDIKKAKKLTYIHDNCGEIVADKLFIKEIKKFNPDVEIVSMVRGKAVLNDVTLEDAKEVSLTDIVNVIPNGTGVPGTSIKRVPEEVRKVLENSDVIISKGQGNFETLMHSDLNIYFIFMCKCPLFAKRFSSEMLKGMFLNDMRMK